MKVKDEAKKILESLSDTADWNDILYHFYVKQKIEYAIIQAKKGNVIPHEEVKKAFIHTKCEDNKVLNSKGEI